MTVAESLSARSTFWHWLEHDVAFTPIELRTMQALGRYFGEWVSMQQLVEQVYGEPPDSGLFVSDSRSLRTHFWRVRAKLQPTPWRIENRYHHGLYRLVTRES